MHRPILAVPSILLSFQRCGVALAVLAAGCATTTPEPAGAKYTAAQVRAAVRKARSDEAAKAEKRMDKLHQAAVKMIVSERKEKAKLAAEKKEIEQRLAEARRSRGGSTPSAVPRYAATPRPAPVVAAGGRSGRAAVSELTVTARREQLFGDRKLVADKAPKVTATQMLELVVAHLEHLGYDVKLTVPFKELNTLNVFGEQKVYLAMSPAFREDFVTHLQGMSVYDAMHLLNKLYGLTAWVGHGDKCVWLGFAAAPPDPVPNTKIDLYFDERRFLAR